MNIHRLFVAGMLLASASAASAVTIVDIAVSTTGTNVRYVKTANRIYTQTGNGTSPVWVDASVTFANAALNTALGTLPVEMKLSAYTTGAAANVFGTFVQELSSSNQSAGTFEVRTKNAVTVGQTDYAAQSNVFTATFGGGAIVGSGTSGSLAANTSGGATFSNVSSDFMTFPNSTEYDLNLVLSSLSAAFGATSGHSLNDFRAKANGSFSSDAPGVVSAVVPEPESWAMLIVGFGLVGAFRRRSTLVVAA